jgi:hypothetical protein
LPSPRSLIRVVVSGTCLIHAKMFIKNYSAPFFS